MPGDELRDAPPVGLRLALLQLCLLAGVLGVGTAMVRTGTDVLQALAHGMPVAVPGPASR